jgi:class 3 adenylate cyclase
MTCSHCGSDNPAGKKFCGDCGAELAGSRQRTVGSAASNLTTSNLTTNNLAPRAYTPKHLAEKILQSKSALEGERKQVSVLFADVKGSMDLAERMDPEEWSQIMQRFFMILREGVERFEGFVDKFTGDGIMALFGAPIAHEDHAQRACYAALHLRDALKTYADALRVSRGIDFAVRLGINSGEVVVGKIGDDLRMDYTAQGHTVGLAARMQSLAPPGGACVSEATARLASGYVELRDLGVATIKGASEPVRVFELEGMGEMRSRFDRSRARGLTRFVGRDADMVVLEQALDQARSGNGQVVGVVAEAGAGKSRLCFEFMERCRARRLTVLHGAAAAHGKNVSLLPILQIVRQYFGIGDQDGDDTAREKIAGRLLRIDESLRELLPVVFAFLGVPDSERPAPQVDPDARQRQLFNVMRKAVRRSETTVTSIEDLHWMDAGSEAWLAQMVDAAAGSKTLVLVTFRPEYHAAWMQQSWYRQLPLLPLSADAIRELLHDLLGADRTIAGLAEAVHARTTGNPFFAEEIIQSLVESGSLAGSRGAYRLVTPIDRLDIPDTVQSILAARIDRLGDREKQALQAAAVIGREFSVPILATVLDWPDRDLSAALQALKDGEFLYEQSLYPVAEYAFKHPLTQEVALGSQLREHRARTHAAVARALEAAHSDRLDEHAALLAHHWEAAGEALAAARWHRRAAEWVLKSDHGECMRHWRRVRTLAGSQPDSAEVIELRLEASSRLIIWSHGGTDDERDHLVAEARGLADRLGDPRRAFMIELFLTTSQMLGGWSRAAPLEAARRVVELAEALDLEVRVLARTTLFNVLWAAGRATEGLHVAEETLELAGGNLELGLTAAGFSFANLALFAKAGLLMWRGHPGEARACFDRSEEVARARNDLMLPQIRSSAGAPFEDLTGISTQALQRSRDAVELAERGGELFAITVSRLYLGWAQLLHGHVIDAVESLRHVDHVQRERGLVRNFLNLGQGLLAEAYLATGDAAQARAAASRCTVQRDNWVYELRAHLSRARVLRALDGPNARAEIEASLARAQLLLEWSGARAFAPFIVEERARLAAVLGDEGGAADLRRRARDLFAEVEAAGHVERLTAELGG